MVETVFNRVEGMLKQRGIDFQVLRHEPVYTSEQAAQVRGTPLASGAKALICKGEGGFVMFVVPADRKLDSHAVRRAKGWRKLRFASREEVMEMTGLAPGSIPPFGSLFSLPTLCDERLGENEVINFNAVGWATTWTISRPVWASSVLFHPTSRAAMEELLAWGLVDVFRQQHPEGRQYSWWDYRMLAFPKNDGLRLDYILATASLADCCASARIDREERKGEKPSDHAPVFALFGDRTR